MAGDTPVADGSRDNVGGRNSQIVTHTLPDGSVAHGYWGDITWQHRPVSEVGVNGTTIEDVVGLCVARLEAFQTGPYACMENERAIEAFRSGIGWLRTRTARRVDQGVEGVNAPHVSPDVAPSA